jgi:CheY-like chemotaxis protein
MAKEFLGSLFVPFGPLGGAVRSRAGLGLGLALVKGFVEAHGGSVHVASDGPGRGATVTMRLPVLRAYARPRQARQTAEPAVRPNHHAHRVLVVEDNPDVAESTRMLLQNAGHAVEIAGDGPTAVEKAQAFRPDVVVCDIALGGDMDGFEVAAALRADSRLKSAYLIALTGYGRDQDRELARRAGFDTHLTKPADPVGLKRLIGGLSPQAAGRAGP